MNVDYNTLLYEKAEKEFQKYKNDLMQMDKEDIFEHSYETEIKQDLLCTFENEELTQTEAKSLYKLQSPLDSCYQEWLQNDRSIMEDLRDTVDDRAKSAIKEMNAKEKESR